MRPSTKPALLPSVQRRNRLTLTISLVALVPAFGFVGQWLSQHPGNAMPLVAIDQISTDVTVASVENRPLFSFPLPAMNALDTTSALEPAAPEIFAAESFPVPSLDTRVKNDENQVWFNGRPLRQTRTLVMTVTGYSPDERSCGGSADGITASGYSVFTNGMRMAAADTRVLPFGSLISVPGYDDNNVIPVLDRGGKIKGHRLDMLYPTHEQAMQWGTKKLEITVWEYADGQPHDYQPIYHADSSINGGRKLGS